MKKTVNVLLFDSHDSWLQEFTIGEEVFFTGFTKTEGKTKYLEITIPSHVYKKYSDAYKK